MRTYCDPCPIAGERNEDFRMRIGPGPSEGPGACYPINVACELSKETRKTRTRPFQIVPIECSRVVRLLDYDALQQRSKARSADALVLAIELKQSTLLLH